MIHAQARALKKNRCGTSPVSKISDNEDATASLGHSEILSVKHSVGEPIPAFDHAPEEGTKVPSSVARQDSGHVLPNDPAGAKAISQSQKRKGQVAALVSHSCSRSRDAE
jgi:hypothetical protein